MRHQSPLPLIVGIPGPRLDEKEIQILDAISPAGIILFARNIVDTEQVRGLTRQLRELEPRPFLTIDLEGGMVNRLSAIWGELPSPSAAAEAGTRAVQALGVAAGAACRFFGIQQDLAPVIDLHRPEGLLAKQKRTLGQAPEEVIRQACAFHQGLAQWCVGGCLKHFPGLGAIEADTHLELPRLDIPKEELSQSLEVFEKLSEEIPVVMVGHVVVPSLGDDECPASLSRGLVQQALDLPGHPVVLSDDLEMGALDHLGDLPDLVLGALKVHHHGVLICSAFDRLQEIAGRLEAEKDADPSFGLRLDEDIARLGTLGHELCRHSASIPAPDEATVAQLWDHARQLSGTE